VTQSTQHFRIRVRNLISLFDDRTDSILGQGACQSIESGFALAQILALWESPDAASAFQFFQDFRKPRTDNITKTSYETGKMASADIPETMWKTAFSPDIVHERMRWVMEYDLLTELSEKLSAVKTIKPTPICESGSSRGADQALTRGVQARL
jgi:hypothetical protein